MAKTLLHYAVQAAKQLGIVPNPNWKLVTGDMLILTFPDGLTREIRTYDGVSIKQVGVNLLAYPITIVKVRAAVKKMWSSMNLLLARRPGHGVIRADNAQCHYRRAL